MPKKITNQEFEDLTNWLQENGVIFKNIHRDFSDAVPVAKLLKMLYPKLIDLHNYPRRNSTQLKLNNWETLNLKVLSKLGLEQNKIMIEKLAKGIPGAIEVLIFDIMQMTRDRRSKGDEKDVQEQIWSENDEVMVVTVNKKIGDAIVQVPQKMILFSIYEHVLKESQTKDSFIAGAQQKITHLENVLKLKAERIDELCAQLAKVSVRSLLNQHNLENSTSNSSEYLLEQNTLKINSDITKNFEF